MSYEFGKYKYLDKLVIINSRFLKDLRPGENIRYNNPYELNHLNNILKGFYRNFFNAESLEEKLIYLLNVTGILLFFQPFYDANSRTLKYFIKIMLKKIKISVDIPLNSKHKDIHIIPFFFDPIMSCSETNVLLLQEIIRKSGYDF